MDCGAPQGEDQKKLDIVSNEVFCNALRNSGKTGVIASEEEDLPVAVEETYSGAASSYSLHIREAELFVISQGIRQDT